VISSRKGLSSRGMGSIEAYYSSKHEDLTQWQDIDKLLLDNPQIAALTETAFGFDPDASKGKFYDRCQAKTRLQVSSR
jgi:hypothetical protein